MRRPGLDLPLGAVLEPSVLTTKQSRPPSNLGHTPPLVPRSPGLSHRRGAYAEGEVLASVLS